MPEENVEDVRSTVRFELAEKTKEKGNALFKSNQFESAASHYDKVRVGWVTVRRRVCVRVRVVCECWCFLCVCALCICIVRGCCQSVLCRGLFSGARVLSLRKRCVHVACT